MPLVTEYYDSLCRAAVPDCDCPRETAPNCDGPRVATPNCDGPRVVAPNYDSTTIRLGDRPLKWHGTLREMLYRSRDACRRIRRWRRSRNDSVYADDWSSDYRWMLSERYAACYRDAAPQDRARRPPRFSDVLVYVANWANVALLHAVLLAAALFTVLTVVPVRSCSLVRRRLAAYRRVVASRPGQDAACSPGKQALVELVVQLAVVGALNLFLLAVVCRPIYRVLGRILGVFATGSNLPAAIYGLFDC